MASAASDKANLEEGDEGRHMIQVREVIEGVGKCLHEVDICIKTVIKTVNQEQHGTENERPTGEVRAEDLLEDAVR